jgi:hypothetical protein
MAMLKICAHAGAEQSARKKDSFPNVFVCSSPGKEIDRALQNRVQLKVAMGENTQAA